MLAKKVLIVDDEKDIVNVLKDYLSIFELDVNSAGSAENALNILEFKRFDIIISDHMMPGIDGSEFTRIVKSLYPETIVIGISGHPCKDAFINAGADEFLSKPINFDQLLEVILK